MESNKRYDDKHTILTRLLDMDDTINLSPTKLILIPR